MIFGWLRRKPRTEKPSRIMVAIDQENCTADGVCETWCSEIFTQLPSGKYGVREREADFLVGTIFEGLDGWARVPIDLEEAVEYVEQNCAGECVFIKMINEETKP